MVTPPAMVKAGESLTVNFAPASGYRLLSVDSSCGGSLQGNAFTVQQVVADCLLEPKFETCTGGRGNFATRTRGTGGRQRLLWGGEPARLVCCHCGDPSDRDLVRRRLCSLTRPMVD